MFGPRAAARQSNPVASLDLEHHGELLAAVVVDREGRAAAQPDGGVAALDRGLDVLRPVARAVDDDDVLGPAGQEELAAAHEPEVAGAEVGHLGVASQAGAEGPLALARLAPVAPPDAGAGHPDLADPAVLAHLAGLLVNHLDHVAGQLAPAAHQRDRRGLGAGIVLGGDRRADLDRDPGRQGGPVEVRDHRLVVDLAAGDDEGRLAEAVAGEERPPAEPARRERRGEPSERLGADRLGPAERHPPAAEVEALAVLGGRPPDAQVEREVRPAAAGAPVQRHRLEPAHRALEERQG